MTQLGSDSLDWIREYAGNSAIEDHRSEASPYVMVRLPSTATLDAPHDVFSQIFNDERRTCLVLVVRKCGCGLPGCADSGDVGSSHGPANSNELVELYPGGPKTRPIYVPRGC